MKILSRLIEFLIGIFFLLPSCLALVIILVMLTDGCTTSFCNTAVFVTFPGILIVLILFLNYFVFYINKFFNFLNQSSFIYKIQYFAFNLIKWVGFIFGILLLVYWYYQM